MQSTVGKADEAKELCDLLLAQAPRAREELTGKVAMQRVHCAFSRASLTVHKKP